jgi:hypothetical protein
LSSPGSAARAAEPLNEPAQLVAEPHAHGTLQLSVGIDGSPRVRLDGTWQRVRGVLIDTDVAHAFDCDGHLTAIG